MRATPLLSILFALPSISLAAECEYKEPKQPPTFTMNRSSGAELRFSADPKWFQCSKKAGATLEGTFFVGPSGQPGEAQKSRKLSSYSARETIGYRDICAAGSGEKEVRFEMKGTGEFSKLDFTSEPASYYCARCERRSYDDSLVIHTVSPLSPKGMFTLAGNIDEEWRKCAKPGSTLEVRLYAAPTAAEAKAATEPTHVLKGLETSAKWKKSFDKKAICKVGSYVGFELHGTGEMQVVNGSGRSIQEVKLSCAR